MQRIAELKESSDGKFPFDELKALARPDGDINKNPEENRNKNRDEALKQIVRLAEAQTLEHGKMIEVQDPLDMGTNPLDATGPMIEDLKTLWVRFLLRSVIFQARRN